jgi:DNA-binding MarR family transcriptional regulator
MNMDHGYTDIPYSNLPKLDDSLPNDYFYSNEYDYLTIQEVQLLLTLSDSQISYSFSGLRKRTSLHQHKLTKAIKRLQDRSFLSKNENGSYELTDNGSIYTRKLLQELVYKKAVSSTKIPSVSLVKKLRTIPPLEKRRIAALLEKRWFSNYRFLYRREIGDFTELCWEDNEKNQCHIYLNSEGEIQIECSSFNQKSSETQLITKWVSEEIQSYADVEVLIDEEEERTKIPYN